MGITDIDFIEKLSIVSDDRNAADIVIKNEDGNKYTPNLYHIERDSSGNLIGESRIRYNRNSVQKPVYMSELNQKLKAYRWLLSKNLYVDEDDIKITTTKFSPKSQVYSLNRGAVVGGPGMSLITSDVSDLNTALDNLLSELSDLDQENIDNMVKTNEVYLLNNSKGSIDFLDMSNTSLLIDYNSSTYTNILDVKKLINKKPIKDNTTLKIDLSIQYSKKNEVDEISGKRFIFGFDITFSGIEIKDGKLIYKNFINDYKDPIDPINKPDIVRVEYLNGVIQLIPLSNDIIECIISNCLVTYGNNEK